MEHEFEKKVSSGLSVIVMMSFDSNYHSVFLYSCFQVLNRVHSVTQNLNKNADTK